MQTSMDLSFLISQNELKCDTPQNQHFTNGLSFSNGKKWRYASLKKTDSETNYR